RDVRVRDVERIVYGVGDDRGPGCRPLASLAEPQSILFSRVAQRGDPEVVEAVFPKLLQAPQVRREDPGAPHHADVDGRGHARFARHPLSAPLTRLCRNRRCKARKATTGGRVMATVYAV